jgi:predicted nucleic acid-binding Zn finger protein
LSSSEAEAIRGSFVKYAKYGPKFTKAVEIVSGRGVKEHRFNPSGRVIYTVVGSTGDEFIDPQKPFCSCSNFFFHVLAGRDDICYHLLSYRIAFESKKLDVIKFSDDEYSAVIQAVVRDVYKVLESSAS